MEGVELLKCNFKQICLYCQFLGRSYLENLPIVFRKFMNQNNASITTL